MAIKKSQLYASLWSSCDDLRGGMDADIDATAAKLTKACVIKQGMMQELLSGRIRLA